ncbi:MAG TPA: MlaD family protein [Arenimonas sp.]|nr:MlaD family protein [Arenimonas sp.]
METRANYVLIGLFTLITAALLVGFALWAAKFASDSSWNEYDVVFSEAVTGLGIGGTVQYNGITVGEVRRLTIDPTDPNKVLVRVRIKADTPIKVDTEARLAFVGLTGITQIQLKSLNARSANLVPTEKNPAPRIIAKESAFSKIFSSTDDITTTATNVMLRLNEAFSDENIDSLGKTLANLEKISGSVADERQDIGLIIRDTRAAIAKLDSTLASTDSIARKLDDGLADQLPDLIAKLDRTLVQYEALARNANRVIDSNGDAIDNFSQQGLAQVGPAIAELRTLLAQLRRVAAQIEERPNALVTGKSTTEEFKP